MNHLPPKESKILTEKLKSVGIEVETEYGYASYELTQKITDPHRPIRRADYPRMSKVPTYTLSEMLELLPDKVKVKRPLAKYWLEMFRLGKLWTVGYFLEDELMSNSLKEFESDTPLLATYHALLWAIDEGYIHN